MRWRWLQLLLEQVCDFIAKELPLVLLGGRPHKGV